MRVGKKLKCWELSTPLNLSLDALLDPGDRDVYPAAAAEPGGRDEPAEALDHDRGPPPAPTRSQEHGLREVL